MEKTIKAIKFFTRRTYRNFSTKNLSLAVLFTWFPAIFTFGFACTLPHNIPAQIFLCFISILLTLVAIFDFLVRFGNEDFYSEISKLINHYAQEYDDQENNKM